MAFDFLFGSAVLIGCFSYLLYSLVRALLRTRLPWRRTNRHA